MPEIKSVLGFRCQVSGVSKHRILNAESWKPIWLQLKANTGERKSISWATPTQRFEFGCWHLTPETWNLNTAGKRCHPYHPSGVDQSRALWTRIFTDSSQTNPAAAGLQVQHMKHWRAFAFSRFWRENSSHPVPCKIQVSIFILALFKNYQ